MKKIVAITAVTASFGLALSAPPTALAQGDPHIPNGDAGWCPGGQHSGGGGSKYCLGVPFASGSFYAQVGSFGSAGPFGPWAWHKAASCKVWVNGSIQGGLPYGGLPDCDGGPATVNL